MLYKVTTERESLHSIVYKYYSSLDMLNKILILNRKLDSLFLKVGDTIYLPPETITTKQREKLY